MELPIYPVWHMVWKKCSMWKKNLGAEPKDAWREGFAFLDEGTQVPLSKNVNHAYSFQPYNLTQEF